MRNKKMRVLIKPSYQECSGWAADYIAYKIKQFRPTAERPFVLGLPFGSTPLGTYAELIKQNRAGKISFQNVVTFNMDEYIGLPPDHPQSCNHFMWEKFFKHIDIKPANVHGFNSLTTNYALECSQYEEAMKKAGGVNLFLCGIGSDGHIAFNEPASSFASRTRIKMLTQETLAANARFFGGDVAQVPRTAFTIGIGTIMDAEEVLLIASGTKKAKAIHQTIEGSVNHLCPASILQMHQHAVIVCDEEAADELKTDTVKYFKNIEAAKMIR